MLTAGANFSSGLCFENTENRPSLQDATPKKLRLLRAKNQGKLFQTING